MPTAPSILVTGAGGFVGRHLIAALRTRLPDATLHAAQFDITDPAATTAAVRAARPDRCLHLAGIAAIADARRDPDAAWRVNLGGTLTLARTLAAEAPDCRLIHASSADIYGASFRDGTPLDERALPQPLNTYAASKAAADLALGAMAAEGLPVIRLRPFNHVGPGQRPDFVLAAFARQIVRIEAGLQEPRLLTGDLSTERDFLDVRDVARAYAQAAAAPDLPSCILNIASGTGRRIGDILADLLRLARVDAAIETDPARLRPTDISRAAGDAAAARTTLGWSPTIPWEQTLLDILADWRARPDRHD